MHKTHKRPAATVAERGGFRFPGLPTKTPGGLAAKDIFF